MEALAAGKPIIATRAGGLVELVDDGANGYTVPIKDPEVLAQARCRFFSLSESDRQLMAAASHSLGQERFDWFVIAKKHVSLYHHRVG